MPKSLRDKIKNLFKEPADNWHWIGTSGWHNEKPENVPKWLIKRTESHPSGIVKGKTFIYKVVYDGGENQGDGHYVYYRKLKRGKYFDKSKEK